MTAGLVVGVVVAAGAWAAMFAVPRRGFWPRAGIAALVIAAYAVAADPGAIGHQLAQRRWPADLGVGLASGLALYALFWLGEQLLVLLTPSLADEVGDLYQVKGGEPAWAVAAIVAVAATGEELFFRGFLWHRGGVVVGLAVYALVHLPERKVILVLAAAVGGAAWGALFAWTGGLVAPLASHLLWVELIVVVHPARPAAATRRLAAHLRGSEAPRRPAGDQAG